LFAHLSLSIGLTERRIDHVFVSKAVAVTIITPM
jgi:hypothetical protein